MARAFPARKTPGPMWRKLCTTYQRKPQVGDRVLLRNDSTDVIATYQVAFKMYTLATQSGLFSQHDLIVLLEDEK